MQSNLPSQHALLLAALRDPDALVERAAVDALGRHPQFSNLRPLLDAREVCPTNDTHLLHVIRMALRDHLAATNNLERLPLPEWSAADEQAIADVCLGTPTAESARFLLRHLQHYKVSRASATNDLRHIARYLPPGQIGELIDFARQKFSDDLDFQTTLFKSIKEGAAERGGELGGQQLSEWGTEIATRLAADLEAEPEHWHNAPVDGQRNQANPWCMQARRSEDGDTNASFISSLPAGETLTGILRSEPFAAPDNLSFFMAGHNGPTNKPDQRNNVVRLRRADTHETLAESFPPRNDVAKPFTWDLHAITGQQVYLEIVDGDTASAYAWLAVGRFNPPVVPQPIVDPREVDQKKQTVAELAKAYKLAALEPQLANWTTNRNTSQDTRAATALALMTINPETHVPLISHLVGDVTETTPMREKMAHALAAGNSEAARAALIAALQTAPERLQISLALALAGDRAGAETLLQIIESGKVSARLLLERSINERLAATAPTNYEARVTTLTQGMPPANEQRQKLLDARRAGFKPALADAASGAKTFAQNCMVCHSLDNRGGAVGPHLDGVGNRGLERLIEDVLDPSRNVDPSFRYSTISLKNGEVFTGLQRRDEGAVVVFVDATGHEVSVAKTDIAGRVESKSSLMPDNFSEAIPVADFNNLMAFLLSQGSGQTANK